MNEPDFEITDKWIVSCRGKKNNVDSERPYGYLVEKERTASGEIEDTAIIFLTNRECPFHCLMCDLWKNTTDETVPTGSIPAQIEWALEQLPSVKHLKLYNSGNFFDRRAVPVEDYERIASIVEGFKTVIVESHPRLINDKCLHFKEMLRPELQIAMGLETAHTGILSKLNKQMTLIDFQNAAGFLKKNEISSRAFILLRPPFLSETEGVYWTKRTLDFAFGSGVECCIIIPVRAGNGAMDILSEKKFFNPPGIKSLEDVTEYGIELKAGRVFADLWDIRLFSSCNKCEDLRIRRLAAMNLDQQVKAKITCDCI
jgi:hypothetical protein